MSGGNGNREPRGQQHGTARGQRHHGNKGGRTNELVGDQASRIAWYADADAMLEAESLDGALVGTRCSLHTEMACKVAAKKLPLYLEKPVATSMDDLRRLHAAYRGDPAQAVVSFPLRMSQHVLRVKEIIASGLIGTVEHVQAYNNVPYGAVYFQGWYRDENDTGGLFLQKATHDFDYIMSVLGQRPVRVAAMMSKQIYKGDKPAGLKCDDCDETATCMESPYNRFRTRHEHAELPAESPLLCAFAEDTGNEDSSSALVEFESGMHVSYSQNFFARRSAGTRGARFLGYKGTVEFDWYTNQIKLFMHHVPRSETIQIEKSDGHAGGDKELAADYIAIVRGTGDSRAPIHAGIASAHLCLMARESARTGTFQEVRPEDLA